MSIMKLDICGCTFRVEDEKTIKLCKIHNTIKESIKHNQSFNLIYGHVDLTNQQSETIKKNKDKERQRIRNLPNRNDHETKISVLRRIRNCLF